MVMRDSILFLASIKRKV